MSGCLCRSSRQDTEPHCATVIFPQGVVRSFPVLVQSGDRHREGAGSMCRVRMRKSSEAPCRHRSALPARSASRTLAFKRELLVPYWPSQILPMTRTAPRI